MLKALNDSLPFMSETLQQAVDTSSLEPSPEGGLLSDKMSNEAWVQTIRESACQSCSARHGCGQKALATLSGGQARQIRVINSLDARPGDQVTVAIEESALLRASLLVYAMPLVLMALVTAMAGALLPGRDGMAMRVPERQLRRDLIQFARLCYERHLLVGLDGNLSARLFDDLVLCTFDDCTAFLGSC